MPQIQQIAKARKSAGTCLHCHQQIAPGDAYLKIEPYTGPTKVIHQRCGPFRSSEQESNEDLSEFYRAQEDAVQQIGEWFPQEGSVADLESVLEEFRDRCQEIGDQVQEKFDNMPEGLQQGDVGQTLEERAQNFGDVDADPSLEDFEEEEEESKETRQKRYHDWMEEQRSAAMDAVEGVDIS
jgi:hypothetical protein